jgi:hypothetical protein
VTNSDIANAISILRPGAQWLLCGDDVANLVWHDHVQSAPSADEIMTAAANLSLASYAARKQAAIAQGGLTVTVSSGVSVWASTDGTSLILLQGAASIAASVPSQTFNWVPEKGAPITLTAGQMTALFQAVSTFLQATFNTLSGVVSAIAAGTITTTAQIDAPPSPIPAWPTNS